MDKVLKYKKLSFCHPGVCLFGIVYLVQNCTKTFGELVNLLFRIKVIYFVITSKMYEILEVYILCQV